MKPVVQLLDHVASEMGLAGRLEAANEILRWWDAWPPETITAVEKWLSEEMGK